MSVYGYVSRPYYLSFSHGNPLLAAELAFGVFSLHILLRVIVAPQRATIRTEAGKSAA